MYKVVKLLHRETRTVQLGMRLLSENRVQRFHKKSTIHIQAKLEKVWTELEAGTRTVDGLLKACARIYTVGR